MAYNLAESFATDNIQVISGLAAGIDAAAHRGCLASGDIHMLFLDVERICVIHMRI